MGENKHIKELDAFAKKYVKEIKQEKPSVDFTVSLMDKIEAIKITASTKVEPLISKKVWYILFIVIVALFFIPFKTSNKEITILDKVDFSFLDKLTSVFAFNGFNVSISNTTVYAFLFFGVMIFLQIIFLKKHFNKRFN
ncbi:hypothetical protein [Polaribacter porphyrae]|uniref:Uncharacterized protein n=1 Tax=Polaribacter porphyrae TaxID=1137780 RepID=A0A2S7WKJ8_9FLAO|nr:hypothetical protein [Polaribacter porphyrae]PQJ78135.1 hypothetical protein BTO18_02525 [Polaribacter porphyrae]